MTTVELAKYSALVAAEANAAGAAQSALVLAAILPDIPDPEDVLAVLDFRAGGYGRVDPATGLLLPVALSQALALTRAGSAQRVGPAGLYVSAGANVARIAHDPITRARRGLLIEPSRTNALFQSRDTTLWTAAGLTQDGTVTAPDGSTVPIWRATNVAEIHRLTRSGQTGVAGNVAMSAGFHIYFPAGHDVTRVFSRARHAQPSQRGQNTVWSVSGAGDATVYVREGGPPFGPGAPAAYASWEAAPAGGGWHRLSILNGALSADADPGTLILDVGISVSATETAAGTAATRFAVWQGQLEPGATASSPIYTAGSALTRAADAATLAGLTGTGDITITWADDSTASAAAVDLATWTIPQSVIPIRSIIVRTPA